MRVNAPPVSDSAGRCCNLAGTGSGIARFVANGQLTS